MSNFIDTVRNHAIASSIGTGVTGYYLIVLTDTLELDEFMLIAVLSLLAFVYIESDKYGGVGKNNE